MIRKFCVQCEHSLPGTKAYYEANGNYCENCIRQLNMKYTIKPTKETRKKWLEKLKVLRKLKKEAALAQKVHKELQLT